jgi:hypothetical protein
MDRCRTGEGCDDTKVSRYTSTQVDRYNCAMKRIYKAKAKISEKGNIFIKGLPFKPGQLVEVTVRASDNVKSKYPLRGKPFEYREPFKDVASNDWETNSTRQK